MKSSTKIFLYGAYTLAVVFISYSVFTLNNKQAPSNTSSSSQTVVPFEQLLPKEMHNRLISQRNYAIQQAKKRGDYKCCIEPPCTMCYMNANKWNNQTPGTCACDDLIAMGKKPCPECERGLCNGGNVHGDKGFCELQ
jgi:hypothetical protein